MKKTLIATIMCLSFFLSSPTSASAATLKVSHNSALSWSARYKVTTSGNRITHVSDIKTHAVMGNITKKYLTHDSPNKVTLHMTRSVGAIKYHVSLSAKMAKGKLVITTN
ncbi:MULTISPECIES: DUF5626 family protein [Lactobacillaceae]|uniref:DUF5626 family protein n=1 Tax=Lactobacillaceae TaxID=33958 RepID=UPI0014575116|nr:DUF5626 family protein [Lactobacillus sp. HBUAS51381]NLR10427.1 DUF5626 family protein [Lactobacillus sp. HBUAS51381]